MQKGTFCYVLFCGQIGKFWHILWVTRAAGWAGVRLQRRQTPAHTTDSSSWGEGAAKESPSRLRGGNILKLQLWRLGFWKEGVGSQQFCIVGQQEQNIALHTLWLNHFPDGVTCSRRVNQQLTCFFKFTGLPLPCKLRWGGVMWDRVATTKARRSALKLPNLEKEANLPAELLAIGPALAAQREWHPRRRGGWKGYGPIPQTNNLLPSSSSWLPLPPFGPVSED